MLPNYPKPNFVSTNGLFSARKHEPVGYIVNAMAAFQETLRPPRENIDAAIQARGRAAFDRAGCASCHSGPALTNNTIVPADQIGGEMTRAVSLAATKDHMAAPQLLPPDTPFPPPQGAKAIPVPVDAAQLAQQQLAWGHTSPGGYKVKALIGLRWSAPYLHDGAVAVGADPTRDLGLPGTFGRGIPPEPTNSLRALLDRTLRAPIVVANAADPKAQASRALGSGHPFYADAQNGFSREDQDALIAYLLAVQHGG